VPRFTCARTSKKYFSAATRTAFQATQMPQKGSQKDRKRHRQSDKIRRRLTGARSKFLQWIGRVVEIRGGGHAEVNKSAACENIGL